MGSLAQLAKASGHRVTGSDANVYPPMSTQLRQSGIEIVDGFDPSQLSLNPDLIVVGNVVSRGNPVMEEILNRGLKYISGPQWLAENILCDRWVLAVSGTHGKTTTASMLAWILEYSGMSPGYLIGGVPGNFPTSARLGETDFFVIEADEYDTAFFDKRSKFVHYRPNTLLINNVEYDHADIFADLQAIQTQFHHVVRIVPSLGVVIHQDHTNVKAVLSQGCWSETQSLGQKGDWSWSVLDQAMCRFEVSLHNQIVGRVEWTLSGEHNIQNAVGAVAAARHVGVQPELACEALSRFRGVKRRMELIGDSNAVAVYDDFAHHPTAIATTLAGLRAKVGGQRIIAIIEPRSNTMKQGVHKNSLRRAISDADEVYWYNSDNDWDLEAFVGHTGQAQQGESLICSRVFDSTEHIIQAVIQAVDGETMHVVIMSNGGFENIHSRLIEALGDDN